MEKKLFKNTRLYKLAFLVMLPILIMFGVTSFAGKSKYRGYMPAIGEVEFELPGGTPFEVDAAQKYPLGTIIRRGGRTFIYAKAGGVCSTEWGAYKSKKTNTNAVAPAQGSAIDPVTLKAAGKAGSHIVTVTIDTEIGVLTTGVLSENELAGGYIVIGNGANQHPQNRMIVSHPELTTAGGTLELTLDSPLSTDVTAGTTNIELMENPFNGVKADGSGGDYVTFIGMPTVCAVSGEFLWLQTWGPVWITSNGATCNSARDRTIVFVGNGSVESSDDETLESGFQIAGVALDDSANGSSNAPFVLLQITP